MKKRLIALSLAAACLAGASTPALAAPKPKPAPISTATVLSPWVCGPSQLGVRWTGTDPVSISLKYGTVEVFPVALNRTILDTNAFLTNLTSANLATMRAVQGEGEDVWHWVATTKTGSVDSGYFPCDTDDPDLGDLLLRPAPMTKPGRCPPTGLRHGVHDHRGERSPQVITRGRAGLPGSPWSVWSSVRWPAAGSCHRRRGSAQREEWWPR